MELKMFVFGENDGVVTWVVAGSKEQSINIFENITGLNIADEFENSDDYVRETSPDEQMTYYHDGRNYEKDTMQNLITKYCDKPDVFATSEF
ncbi:hypothetical protein [Virgibacillus salexigens]|uniref:Uncharacterized protein n=1 Tax=Virgibacillus kapii TaxID=1638645 RepID=A0ABQ2D9X4_9BACI|nr:hypothetical protein [Virgibacillus kapii]GGJ48891.1 hypothetical protein GCM10007111_08670 [Virgibacillus kapii]